MANYFAELQEWLALFDTLDRNPPRFEPGAPKSYLGESMKNSDFLDARRGELRRFNDLSESVAAALEDHAIDSAGLYKLLDKNAIDNDGRVVWVRASPGQASDVWASVKALITKLRVARGDDGSPPAVVAADASDHGQDSSQQIPAKFRTKVLEKGRAARLLGYEGKNPQQWLARNKKKYPFEEVTGGIICDCRWFNAAVWPEILPADALAELQKPLAGITPVNIA